MREGESGSRRVSARRGQVLRLLDPPLSFFSSVELTTWADNEALVLFVVGPALKSLPIIDVGVAGERVAVLDREPEEKRFLASQNFPNLLRWDADEARNCGDSTALRQGHFTSGPAEW